MAICDNCHVYKMHGKNCWYYWEGKRTCSQFKRTADDSPCVREE